MSHRPLLALGITLAVAACDAVAAGVTVAAGGDLLLVEAPAPECRERVAEALAVLREADLAVANLETSLVSAEVPPASASGGLWLRAAPGVAEWLGDSGLDVLSVANNHAGDWGEPGLDETRARLATLGLAPAGAGTDLASAWAAVVQPAGDLDVAVVAAACVPPQDPMRARDAEPGFAARPGIAAIDTRVVVTLSAAKLGVLAAMLREAGLAVPTADTNLELGRIVIRRGRLPGLAVELSGADVARLREAVAAAARSAPIVLVSLHCAEAEPGRPGVPAALRTLASELAASGADAVLVHGPHEVRGAEWLEPGAAALYGLGSVVLQHRQIGGQPREAAAGWGLSAEVELTTLLDRVETAMGPEPELWSGLAATLVFDRAGRLLRVELEAWDLAGHGPEDPCRGLPAPAEGERRREILDRVVARSQGLGGVLDPTEVGLRLTPSEP